MPADDDDHLGMQFVFHPSTHRQMGGVSYHTVEAWSAEHAGTEWARTHPVERSQWEGSMVDPGHRPLSTMSWQHETGEIKGVNTAYEHQRKGLATRVWQEGHRIAGETRGVKPPKHSRFRTNAGEGWARAVGGRVPPRTFHEM